MYGKKKHKVEQLLHILYDNFIIIHHYDNKLFKQAVQNLA